MEGGLEMKTAQRFVDVKQKRLKFSFQTTDALANGINAVRQRTAERNDYSRTHGQ
jgi:hypothetical protein